ncbi:FtsX-like permease family protein [Maricaulis sp.]|uniref:FtsX-like permease family protein n=1 Tax=Maricaulis sp. TaxID=1486257 RepID=UPI003299E30C
MRSLAIANIETDWRRHAAAISVLVMAGLLIVFQAGMALGEWRGLGAFERQLRADIVIIRTPGENAHRFEMFVNSVPLHLEGQVWLHPNVERVEAFGQERVLLNWPEGDGEGTARISGRVIDPSPDSLSFPAGFSDRLRTILATPGQLVMTRQIAERLGLEAGDYLPFYEVGVRVGAVFDSNMFAGVFMSRETVQLLGEASRTRPPSAFLVRLHEPALRDATLAELNTALSRHGLSAITPADMVIQTSLTELADQDSSRNMMISGAFAVLIAMAIAAQTLRNAVISQREEFAALRALGVGAWRIALIAMEQALWTGITACALTISGGFVLKMVMTGRGGAFVLSPGLIGLIAIILIGISLLAGLLSLSAVTKSRPTALLR